MAPKSKSKKIEKEAEPHKVFETDLVDDDSLANLKTYKYASVDKSPITYYILRHYWDWAVKFFPMWMAPNLITLCGLGFVLINCASIYYYIPDLIGPAPRWLYWTFPAGLWLYSTFDNVDGRQARRTGSSSPLGELFDHGVDSLNCTFGAILQLAAIQSGHTPLAVGLVIVPTWPMYLSTWEEYHTGVLYLGYFNGPTEGILLACTFMIISAVHGPEVWGHLVKAKFESLPSWVPDDLTWKQALLFLCLFALIVGHAPACFYNVYVARKKKGLSLVSTLPQLLPMVIFTSSQIAWVLSPYSQLLERQELLMFSLATGFVFGRLATKIILAHLTKREFPWFTTMIFPIILGGVLVNLPFFGVKPLFTGDLETKYLQAFLAFATAAYFQWAFKIISRLCRYLDISCLSIKHKQQQKIKQK